MFVTTCYEKNTIRVFGDQETMNGYARECKPFVVYSSQHPSVKKANAFAKKLHKKTPTMDLVLCSSTK